MIVSGRNAPVVGLENMPGPMVTTTPVRVKLDRKQRISKFLKDVQTQANQTTAYEQYGMQNIIKLNPEAREACDFTSLLAVQPVQSMFSSIKGDNILETPDASAYDIDDAMDGYFNYPLVLQAHTLSNSIKLVSTYHVEHISEQRIEAMTKHLEHIIGQLVTRGSRPMSTLTVAGDWDLQKALAWNSSEVDVREHTAECIHDVISTRARQYPHHDALLSSSETVSYADLDQLTDTLANFLRSHGVGPESKVPMCFEKSIWAIISMIGIMKAGGCFIPMDPNHPYDRRQGLMEQLEANILLVSPTTASRCLALCEKTFVVTREKLSEYDQVEVIGDVVKPSPSNAAYILFTSGSTGKPKGILVEHLGFTTSMLGDIRAFGYDKSIRMFQFGTYTFDASLTEIFCPLLCGGVLCIPTEDERMYGATRFITENACNTSILTPSFARTLNPQDLPCLKNLLVCGEPPGKDTIETWVPYVKLINGYGPTEAIVYNLYNIYETKHSSPTTIGRNVAHYSWVVDPDDHNKLCPIGSIGELFIQGHCIARGYLNDPDRTAASFVTSASWLRRRPSTRI